MTTLTRRQAGILALVADGLTNAAIGRRLGIRTNTVSDHLKAVYARIGARNRTAAVVWLWQQEQPGDERARRSRQRGGGCLVFANQQSALAALAHGEDGR